MDNAELGKLFARLRSGDETAFEDLYNDLKTPAHTVILRITRDRQLA